MTNNQKLSATFAMERLTDMLVQDLIETSDEDIIAEAIQKIKEL